MPGNLTVPDTTDIQSSLIPKGRENDYWELSMPTPVSILDMVIDEPNMYIAPLLITNGSEDRDGEVTNPEGLIDIAYRDAPVVFLQHSHRVAPMEPPVGTAETPDRQFNLFRKGDGWYSGCRFHNKTPLAVQTFQLVCDGVIRGRSIGALNHALTPYKPKLPGVAFVNNTIMPVRTKSVSHDKYELIEWSWVFMPSNRDITTKRKPNAEYTPDREVVPVLKSILSNNRIAGMPLDPSMKFIMKSLNLAEPTTATFHKAKHWPLKSIGETAVETPFQILFSRQHYTPALAKQFLAKSTDVGLIDTQLEVETKGSGSFLKSVQFAYNGPTEDREDPEVPGLILRFMKAVNPADAVAAEVDKDKVDIEAAQTPAGTAQVAEAAAAEVAEEMAEVAAVVPDETKMVKAEKPGLRYLKSLYRQLTEVADKAEAGLDEQEQELFEKCQGFTSELRSFIGKVAEFQTERYGKEEKPETEEMPETAMLEKSVRADLFYGRKAIIPTSIKRGLDAMHSLASNDKQKALAGAMLKGCVAAIPEAKQTPQPEQKPSQDSLREIVRRKLRQQVASKLT